MTHIISGRYTYVDGIPIFRVKAIVDGKYRVVFANSADRRDIEKALRIS